MSWMPPKHDLLSPITGDDGSQIKQIQLKPLFYAAQKEALERAGDDEDDQFFELALLATGSPAFAAKEKGSSGRQAQAKGTREIPVCTKKLGAIAIVEPDNQWWREFNLGSPEAILKVFVQKSGCFTLVNRGRSMGSRAMERAMADNGELQAGSNLGKGQVKAADYFLQPDIVTTNSNSGGGGIAGGIGGMLGGRMLGGLLGGQGGGRSAAGGGLGDLLGAALGGGRTNTNAGAGAGGLGDLLGGALGGGRSNASAGAGAGGLGDLLGGALGGGAGGARPAAAGGGLGDLLGSVLGGGRTGGASSGRGNSAGMAILATIAMAALKNWTDKRREQASMAGGAAGFAAQDLETMTAPDTEALILRAMVSAAKADGQIEEDEVQRIVGKVGADGLSEEEKQFLISELRTPLDLDALVADVPNEMVAAEVYAASLLAIDLDTQEEVAYLRQLARALGLDGATVARLHQITGATQV